MKKTLILLILTALVLCGCSTQETPARIAATTLPVYQFTQELCRNTDLTVTRLVTEEVSCLHDYSLNVRQVKAAEAAEAIVISGAGLEDFMADLLEDGKCIDASAGIALLCPEDAHDHEHDHDHGHHHAQDPHIWLCPRNAQAMAANICRELSARYPQHEETFAENLARLNGELEELYQYAQAQLQELSCRELITFHDGFAYLAHSFDLTILDSVEEESGSEASSQELIHLVEEVRHHGLPAIFTEKSGSTAAAGIIAQETGCQVYSLDMAMAGDSYFDAMYHNIDTLKEALG